MPPGFVPDPEYTWVPRTKVRERTRTTYADHHDDRRRPPPGAADDHHDDDPDGTDRHHRCRTGTAGRRRVTPPTTTVDRSGRPGRVAPPITLPVLPGTAPPGAGTPDARDTATACTQRGTDTPSTLACRDDHPRQSEQAVQILGSSRAG